MTLGFSAVCLEGGHEADVLQHTWMQIMRKKPDGFGDTSDSGIDV